MGIRIDVSATLFSSSQEDFILGKGEEVEVSELGGQLCFPMSVGVPCLLAPAFHVSPRPTDSFNFVKPLLCGGQEMSVGPTSITDFLAYHVYTVPLAVPPVSHLCALPKDVKHQVSTVLSHVVMSKAFVGSVAITEA